MIFSIVDFYNIYFFFLEKVNYYDYDMIVFIESICFI